MEIYSLIEKQLYWIKEEKYMEGYPLVLYTVNPSTSPGASQHFWVKNLVFSCPSSWSSGGGACCADSQVCAPGGAAPPRASLGSVEAVYPLNPLFLGGPASQAHGETKTTMVKARVLALESAPHE